MTEAACMQLHQGGLLGDAPGTGGGRRTRQREKVACSEVAAKALVDELATLQGRPA